MKSIFKTLFLSLCIIANTHFAYAQTASILPQGKTQFTDNNGKPLASGTVDFYIPSTTTRKTTWQNSGETISNTNPVVLDGGGRAIIYGDGNYRMVVKDRLGNLIYDQLTSSTGTGSSAPTATGDGDLVGTIKPWGGMTAPNQYLFTYGQEISRTTYAALYTAITSTQPVFCNSGSPTLTGLSDTTNFWVGMSLEVSCVVAGFSTVVSKTSNSVTMAANANVSTNTTATFFPWGRGNGSTTFNLPDLRGVVLAGNNNMGGVASSNLTTTYFGATNPNSAGALGGGESNQLTQPNLPTTSITNYATTALSVTSTISNIGTGADNAAITTGAFVPGVQARSSVTSTGTLGINTISSLSVFSGGTAIQASIANAGSGYTNGSQTITVAGGTCTIQPQFTITVSGNVFTGTPALLTAGSCTVAPTNPASTTGGGGTGGTLNIFYTGSPIRNVQPTRTTNYIIKVTPDTNSATASGVTSLGGMTGDIACGTNVTCTGNIISVSGNIPITVGTTIVTSGTSMGVLYDNAGVIGNTAAGTIDYALMGNGASAPSFKGFIQPLTNAITRTWQSKSQEPISVKDFGVVCDGGTDNTTAFQNAINALPSNGGTLIIPGGNANCVIASSLDFTTKRNITIRGDSSFSTAGTASNIVYSGSGARVFDVRDTTGIVFEKLSVTLTNNAFAGIVFDAGTAAASVSSYFKLSEVSIIGNGTNTPTCVNVSNAIESLIDRVSFSGCDIGIRGQQTLGQSTVVKIFSSQFFATKTIPISDCGESWSIVGNTFEQLATTNNAGAISINSARPCKNIVIQSNWFGDANSSGTWINLAANGAQISGNRIANGAVGITMTGGAGYSIRNNNMENTTAFSCASSPTGGEIASNVYTSVTTYVSGTCVNFNIQGVSGTTLVSKQVLVNATSGSITLQPVTGALGTRTINVPAASGTMAVSATTPITLSAAGDVGFAGVPTTDASPNATYYVCLLAAASGNNNCTVDSVHFTINPSIPAVGIGTTPQTTALLSIAGGGSSLTGTNQFALNFQPTFSSAATSNGFGIYVKTATANASFSTIARQLYIDDMIKGASSTITTQYQIYVVQPTKGSTNWAIYSEGGASYNGGTLSVGTTTVPGTTGAILSNAYVQTGAIAVGSLPTCNATQKAARHFVTDANATFTAGIGAIVAAGGANNVPVVCDGTNWRIG